MNKLLLLCAVALLLGGCIYTSPPYGDGGPAHYGGYVYGDN